MNQDNYVVKSLELHLFFGRIMKEHSLFLKAGFTPVDMSFSKKATFFQKEFEKLLCQAVNLCNGKINKGILESQELVTNFTVTAEQQTERLTGISINKEITEKELRLVSGECACGRMEKHSLVKKLNCTALNLLDGLIQFKESILNRVLCCEMFTVNYPLLLEHIIREAKLYRKYVDTLEKGCDLTDESMKEVECFWNQIMMEHAMFIRGLLDPSEEELFNTANQFAKDYSTLLKACQGAYDKNLTQESLKETVKFRNFKAEGTQGIEQCKIRSIILPLLADHVLREANHYVRLLKC